jgi:hypothetical protein
MGASNKGDTWGDGTACIASEFQGVKWVATLQE